jgi:hypothetical protein
VSAGVQWKNAARFKKKLALLPPAVAEAARGGLVDRAQQVVDAMKQIVPVRTGRSATALPSRCLEQT